MKRILIVDDSKTIRESLRFFLEQGSYQVEAAEDGLDALKTLELSQFDLIITDINMPNMGGLDLISKVRALSLYRFTPILVLTTESQSSIIDEGRKRGATGWIVKPFQSDKVIATVKKVLGD